MCHVKNNSYTTTIKTNITNLPPGVLYNDQSIKKQYRLQEKYIVSAEYSAPELTSQHLDGW